MTRRGFTLIEVFVTLAVATVLISLIAPAIQGARLRGRATGALADIQAVAQGTIMYVHARRDLFPYAGRPGEPFTPVVINGVESPQEYLYAHAAFVPNLVRPYLDKGLTLSFLGENMTPEETAALVDAPSPIARFWFTQATATDPTFWSLGGPSHFSLARATRDSEVRFPAQKVLLHSLSLDPTTGQRAIRGHRFRGVAWAMMDASARTLPRAQDMTPSFSRPWGIVPLRGIATEHGLHGIDTP